MGARETYSGASIHFSLIVTATDKNTDIWLVDENGYPVQKSTDTLATSVCAGTYLLTIRPKLTWLFENYASKTFSVHPARTRSTSRYSTAKVLFPSDGSYQPLKVPDLE